MIHLLAQVQATSDQDRLWLVIVGIGVLASLALNGIQILKMANGTDGNRQIEPTAIAAIQTELQGQTRTLNKLDREMGGMMVETSAIKKDVAEIRDSHRRDIEGIHARIGGISREVARSSAQIEGLEKREGEK